MIIVRLTIGTNSESVALGSISHSAPSFFCAFHFITCCAYLPKDSSPSFAIFLRMSSASFSVWTRICCTVADLVASATLSCSLRARPLKRFIRSGESEVVCRMVKGREEEDESDDNPAVC